MFVRLLIRVAAGAFLLWGLATIAFDVLQQVAWVFDNENIQAVLTMKTTLHTAAAILGGILGVLSWHIGEKRRDRQNRGSN